MIWTHVIETFECQVERGTKSNEEEEADREETVIRNKKRGERWMGKIDTERHEQVVETVDMRLVGDE